MSLREWLSNVGRRSSVRRDAGGGRSGVRPCFEALEPRELLAGDLPSILRIEADNRGLVTLTASANLDASTINSTSVIVSTAGEDRIFGTADDELAQRTVTYDAANRRIRIEASVQADVRYRVRLDGSIIRGADGRLLDGEFRGASTISGDGVQGGDLSFFTRRPAQEVIRFDTISGVIDANLFRDRAPLTVQNFLNYANRGVFDQTFIHRSANLQQNANVPANFVIQLGGFFSTPPFDRIPTDPPVRNEPGISNLRGTLAMAKIGSDPNSATNQFFFNLGDNSANLDNQNGGFTVFAEVRDAAGLAVMDALAVFQRINANQVNGAFNELPVVDRDAVLNRPGGLNLMTTDLVRFTRVALLVDITDVAAGQLDETGSVAVEQVDGAVVRFYDLDQAGLGSTISGVSVSFGRSGVINSITLRDGFPTSRVGIVISNAASVGRIIDLRTNPGEGLTFIASSAPVSSISINSILRGLNLNEVAIPGVVFETDIDSDADLDDRTSILVMEGFVQTLTLPAGVGGDVVLRGGAGVVRAGGVASGADFDIGASGQNRFITFTFARVVDVDIRTEDAIRSITALEWLDESGLDDGITAPNLGVLMITGDRREGIAGDFGAGLTLTQAAGNAPVLRSARIAGSILDADWSLRGPVGSLSVGGDAVSWDISNASSIASIVARRVQNAVISSSGRIARVQAFEWQGGHLTAASLGSFNITGDRASGIAGDYIANLTVNGGGTSPVISRFNIAGSLLNSQVRITGPFRALSVGGDIEQSSITVTGGDVRQIEVRGTIRGSTVNVATNLQLLRAQSFDAATIQGGFVRDVISMGDFSGEVRPTNLGELDVRGNFAGSINVRTAETVRISGDTVNSTFTFTQAPDGSSFGVENFLVRGTMEFSEVRLTGVAGTVEIGMMVDSGVYAGAPTGLFGLPVNGSGMRQGAGIQVMRVTGLGGRQPSFVNSFVVANAVNRIEINRPGTDNLGRVFGVAFGAFFSGIEIRTDSGVRSLRPGQNTPFAVGDFQVRPGYVSPDGGVL